MADAAAELLVKIRGDASDLEGVINGVASELGALEKAQSGAAGAGAAATKGFAGQSSKLSEYRQQMQKAQDTLNTSRAVLNNTKKAYEDNKKSIAQNITALKQEKTELGRTISIRTAEKNLLTEANKHLDKNTTAYRDNQKAIRWIDTELSDLEQRHKTVTDTMRTYESALAGSKKAYENARTAVSAATKQYEEYEKGLKAVERAEKANQLQETGKKWKEVGEGIDTVTKPLQYTAVALATGGVAAAKFAINFEDSFAAVKKQLTERPNSLNV